MIVFHNVDCRVIQFQLWLHYHHVDVNMKLMIIIIRIVVHINADSYLLYAEGVGQCRAHHGIISVKTWKGIYYAKNHVHASQLETMFHRNHALCNTCYPDFRKPTDWKIHKTKMPAMFLRILLGGQR